MNVISKIVMLVATIVKLYALFSNYKAQVVFVATRVFGSIVFVSLSCILKYKKISLQVFNLIYKTITIFLIIKLNKYKYKYRLYYFPTKF